MGSLHTIGKVTLALAVLTTFLIAGTGPAAAGEVTHEQRNHLCAPFGWTYSPPTWAIVGCFYEDAPVGVYEASYTEDEPETYY